jgi:hypothetical protein
MLSALVAAALLGLVVLAAITWPRPDGGGAPPGGSASGSGASASGASGSGASGSASVGPASPAVSSPGAPVTIAAVGDLVCDPRPNADEDGNGSGPRQCQEKAVSDLLVARHPAALLALGDTQYADGSLDAYRSEYAPTYGRLFDVTFPVPGNHEYGTRHAAGYYAYFGTRAGSPSKGYYSFDVGGWHVVALNSNCDDVSCAAGSAQERWLRSDLEQHPAACTLAYWHYPRWSHGEHGDNREVGPLFQALSDARVELLLTGHDHDYERFAPRTPSGKADPDGVREFVVGTGGRNIRAGSGGAGTEVMETDSFGALFLTLSPTGYRWEFGAVNGSTFTDTGSGTCH